MKEEEWGQGQGRAESEWALGGVAVLGVGGPVGEDDGGGGLLEGGGGLGRREGGEEGGEGGGEGGEVRAQGPQRLLHPRQPTLHALLPPVHLRHHLQRRRRRLPIPPSIPSKENERRELTFTMSATVIEFSASFRWSRFTFRSL